jgi:hypothetical protein
MDRDIRLVEKSYELQRKQWKASRMFWTIMGLVLMAASLGFFGDGPVSKKTYTTSNLQIEYNRFLRIEKATEVHINVKGLGKDPVISINNDYLKKVKIEQVIPEPASVEAENNILTYRFSSIKNGLVTFYLSPQKMGSQKLEFIIDGNKMSFDQYIYF